MTLDELNTCNPKQARNEFLRCCGSTEWAKEMTARRPFKDVNELLMYAEEIWKRLSVNDWKEAFSHHPKIGDIKSLRKKFESTEAWAANEQSGVDGTSEKTLEALAEGNRLYEAKFGYIFIVCATGKSAVEMLSLLNERLDNNHSDEIKIAAREQAKITNIRLTKLLTT